MADTVLLVFSILNMRTTTMENSAIVPSSFLPHNNAQYNVIFALHMGTRVAPHT